MLIVPDGRQSIESDQSACETTMQADVLSDVEFLITPRALWSNDGPAPGYDPRVRFEINCPDLLEFECILERDEALTLASALEAALENAEQAIAAEYQQDDETAGNVTE